MQELPGTVSIQPRAREGRSTPSHVSAAFGSGFGSEYPWHADEVVCHCGCQCSVIVATVAPCELRQSDPWRQARRRRDGTKAESRRVRAVGPAESRRIGATGPRRQRRTRTDTRKKSRSPWLLAPSVCVCVCGPREGREWLHWAVAGEVSASSPCPASHGPLMGARGACPPR